MTTRRRTTRHRPRSLVVAAIALIMVPALAWIPASSAPADPGTYQALIRRTEYGVPHVSARTLGGAGFGQGWAYAEDRFCDLADQVVKVRSERSRWFGPGEGQVNLGTDLGYLGLGLMERAREQADELTGDARQLLDGYVAGFNAYFSRIGPANVPGWCAGEPWLGPITVVDVLAVQRDIALADSGATLLGAIALAEPPAAGAPAYSGPPLTGGPGLAASNAWALGADRSVHGRGMLLANPHFPWQGERKFWEVQLTVPGKLNVYGAALAGIPGVQIGFNDRMAWTHTAAAGTRYTLYSVDLVADAPTTYLVDGEPEPMTSRQVTVEVDWGDGEPQPLERTLWSTRYGPVLDLSAIDPTLGWSDSHAITYRDANIDNDALMEQWLDISRARDVAGVRRAIAHWQGVPWVNTLAADRRGDAWYADASATPNLPAAALEQWREHPDQPLDGSDSRNTWMAEPWARTPGLIPFWRQPQLLRRDYVLNANDSYWFTNPHELLTGFAPLQGAEGVPLSVRTRQNVRLLEGPGPAGDARPLDLPDLASAVMSGQALTSDLLVDYIVAACEAHGAGQIEADGQEVDLRPGCKALADWDRTFHVDSRGAVLWREVVSGVLLEDPEALQQEGPLFGVGFDPADPSRTPGGVPGDPAPLLAGLARALLLLTDLGLAPDVRLGDVQQTVLPDGRRLPVPGAGEAVGVTNVVGYTPFPGSSREPMMDGGKPVPGSALTDQGYVVNVGTSFVMVVAFTSRGPVGQCLLTFGQSMDPASGHVADQLELFARGQLRECRFTERAIRSDPQLEVEVVKGDANE